MKAKAQQSFIFRCIVFTVTVYHSHWRIVQFSYVAPVYSRTCCNYRANRNNFRQLCITNRAEITKTHDYKHLIRTKLNVEQIMRELNYHRRTRGYPICFIPMLFWPLPKQFQCAASSVAEMFTNISVQIGRRRFSRRVLACELITVTHSHSSSSRISFRDRIVLEILHQSPHYDIKSLRGKIRLHFIC